jgi:two-component system LytT family response regulator
MNTTIYQLESVKDNFICLLRQNTKIYLSEIIFLEADINYTHFYLRNGKKITVAKTLKVFEIILENHHFYRIHRSFLINYNHLLSYDSRLGELMLTNNHRAITSRRRKDFFEYKIFNNV